MKAFLSGFVLIFFSSVSFAQNFFGEGIYSRQGEKESVRWTLADWMTQKKAFRAMDMWLALNRQANLFELNLEGSQYNYEYTTSGVTTDRRIDRYSAQIWVSIFGLQYTHEESDEDWKAQNGQLNVRLFGQSTQTTNLTFHYGFRQWEDQNSTNEYNNQYGGLSLNLYLVSFFGLEGMYRKYLKAEDKLNREIEGERSEYGAFIDISFVRIYGNAFKEKFYISTAGTTSIDSREGVDAGVRLYF